MPRLTPLPEQWKYLQPFRQHVLRLKPEEINEDVDLSLLHRLLCNRIRGFSTEKAKRVLNRDADVLAAWLAAPSQKDDRLHFLGAYLGALPKLVDRIRREQNVTKPQDRIKMDFPERGRTTAQRGGGWKMNWLQATMFVFPSTKKCLDAQVSQFQSDAKESPTDVRLVRVALGRVRGLKRVMRSPLGPVRVVDYALRVPGGCAIVGLVKRSEKFDELPFEAYLRTIQVVHG